jgi:hypothetical protein
MKIKRNGPPAFIETPAEFEAKVEAYRQHCEDTGEPLTQTGMAWFMGFASRQSFYDYSKRAGFERAVARARLLVEWAYEQRLHGKDCTGAIFALKNQGWTDRQDVTVRQTDYVFSASDFSRDGLQRVASGEDPQHVLSTGGGRDA